MANKFQKSIKNRIELESARKNQAQPEEDLLSAWKPPEDPAAQEEEALPEWPGDFPEDDEDDSEYYRELYGGVKINEYGRETYDAVEVLAPLMNTTVEELTKTIEEHERKEAADAAIGGYLHREVQRAAKNKTFYLDEDLVEAIRKIARREGVTDSRLVNDALRHVLGL